MKTEDRGEDPRKKSSRESCKVAGRNVTGLLENSQAREEEEGRRLPEQLRKMEKKFLSMKNILLISIWQRCQNIGGN